MNPEFQFEYEREGVVEVPGLYTASEIGVICDALQRYVVEKVASLPRCDYVLEADGRAVRNLWRMEQHSEYFKALAEDERIRGRAKALVGSEPVLMAVESFCKPARVGSGVPPHQDNAYFCLAPPDALTIWIALDAVTPENGPVNYVRGSHKGGVLPHARSGVAGNSVGLCDPLPEHEPFVGLLNPGDALIHHANTIHYSLPNRTDYARRALLMVFRGSHCEPDPVLKKAYLAGQP
ncbi:MAG: phytanoyl-CoA dioxygenase family protein [Candidatus Hydrogenedentes bacterium]|nr:phytanoyl-CoA dioxygenase family protein [Candidatus Hydrogenedentota bacterium]